MESKAQCAMVAVQAQRQTLEEVEDMIKRGSNLDHLRIYIGLELDRLRGDFEEYSYFGTLDRIEDLELGRRFT